MKNPVNPVNPVHRDCLLFSLTNRYTAIDAAPLAHDTAGNLTRNRQNYRYEYDYENRIARIYKLSGETQITVASFDYDALGHRIRKIDAVAGQTTLYYNDPEWRILAEYAPTNNQQLRKYVYGNYLDEALRMTDTYAGDDTPVGDYYFLQDHLYSPAVLLSSAGAVIERYEFDAYGTRHVFDQNFGTRGNTNYGVYVAFQGHNHDRLDNGNLNLLDARYRTYDPFAGRWLMQEKLGLLIDSGNNIKGLDTSFITQYEDGLNLYLFVQARPTLLLDPTGLVQWYPNVDIDIDTEAHPDQPNSPSGDILIAETDKATKIKIWRAHDGKSYWCHGYTFGGYNAFGGPYSVWGYYVPTILQDDGWKQIPCSWAKGGSDIAIFYLPGKISHSGIIRTTRCDIRTRRFSEDGSTLTSKWDMGSLNTSSFSVNFREYGYYACYSKEAESRWIAALGTCCGKGEHELGSE